MKTLFDNSRILVWFSCGAASACAAFMTCQKYPHCEVIYCDTSESEHPDNMRFLAEYARADCALFRRFSGCVCGSEGEISVVSNLERKSIAAERMFAQLVELMGNELGITRTNPFVKKGGIPSWI